ncbi:hypothetical protein E3P92_03969 [Wallemia ichthyophaga]|uniref:Eukaryotic translation initiation factor 2 subunit gamma n=2 Tax=Wallemia ichthyophaga TaxID=245174 RepID=A0A4T0FN82_WALIC|nr:Eukaryotic translation initiation factor 2 subunit gamma [Wallemia ichthyophaga EXF-994]TIA70723.1 hypothetical protein E3P91_02928 [Wallemia ichthyophaga]EOQ99107.1 Eukaryotic translation initiation factor 2 subunit gamma [Wallemia ichthyophaga EXF-994]TIA79997.1 hypothetical protein E3P98_02921 [Wallemia ichthyophaga]TIA88954.1 hypothetical protein E3P97_03272 [Wallemia ichthyophaga]TIA94929.1 hypothetical protein E3P95_03976 [Wallemia ichthyophaga]
MVDTLSSALNGLSINDLHPLHQSIIQGQATINIGTIGHVAHGKSTVVKSISGVHTVRFKNELERNITIKLGYANAKIFKCDEPSCPRPGCYRSYPSNKEPNPLCENENCQGSMHLVRHVSFVDCPGHDILMATMLNGAAVMDAALLLVAANESCPQPQTSEHLAAVEIMKLKDIIILQNKVDLIREQQAEEHWKSIVDFVHGTSATNAPIVPISAQLKYNIDAVCEYLVKTVPVPERDFAAPPKLIVIRSFDVNKPGSDVDDLKGGVAGGSILQGVLHIGQEIEVRPGIVTKDNDGNIHCKPIKSKIVSLLAEQNKLNFAVPGGLIGVGTKIDPTLCRADRLVGQVLGAPNGLPFIYTELEINYFLLRRLLGVKSDDKKQTKVAKLAKNEVLMVNIGSTSTGGRVMSVKADLAKIYLTSPACTEVGEKVALSRRIERHWRLVGWGTVVAGQVLDIESA